ncbi:helix-turn-helix transcriptional regulator, partial [Pseudomonas aeruginosa]
MDIDELIARRLAALRKERELTLAQLAERCAVSKAMISRIERNQSSPTASVLGRLAGGPVSYTDLRAHETSQDL